MGSQFVDDLVIDQKLKERILKTLRQQAPQTLYIGLIAAFILFLVLWGSVDSRWLTSWVVIIALVTIARVLFISYWDSAAHPERRIWESAYVAGALTAGLVWAALLIFYTPSLSLYQQLFILLIFAGTSAASIATNAPHYPTYLAFSGPQLLALLYCAMFCLPELNVQFSLITGVYVVMILATAYRFGRTTCSNIRSRLHNEHLLEEVQAANRQLSRMAYQDPLTSLDNRRSFEIAAEKALQSVIDSSGRLVLMMIDIDNFKLINDQHGHKAGDHLLVEISRRIRTSIRQRDHGNDPVARAARLGGDEFIVLYILEDETTESEMLAERLVEDLAQPLLLKDEVIQPTVSIGVSEYPRQANRIGRLLRLADKAMYHAKSRGGGQYFVCESDDTALDDTRF